MSIPPDSGGSKKPRAYTSQPPDWLKSGKPGPETRPSTMPDWLNFKRSAGVTPPAEPPDWLAKVAQVFGGGVAIPPVARPPVSAPPAQPEDSLAALRPSAPPPEDDLFAMLRAETPKPPVAASGPGETPDWLAARDEEDKPGEEAASALPDWMSEPAASAGSADIPDWLGQSAGTPAEEPTSALPDWMSSEPAAAASEAESRIPDWLGESVPHAADTEMPDWMKAAHKEEAEAKPSPPPSAGVPMPTEPGEEPDWIDQLPRAESAPPPAPAAPGKTSELLSRLADGAPASTESKPKPKASGMLTETPDWLNQLGKDDLASAEPPPPAEAPDWLGQVAGETPPPAEPTPPAAEALDWLEQIAGETPSPAEPTLPAAEAPDWLEQAAGETPSPAEPTPPAAEALDWLDQAAGETPSPAEPTPPPAAALDWLDQAAGETPSPAEPPPPPAAPAATPGWMDQLTEGAPPSAEPRPRLKASGALTPPPDWLDQLAKAESAPAPAEPTPPPTEPAGPAETPDWLNQLAEAAPTAAPAEPASPAAAPAGSTETPDWLNQLAEAAPVPASPPAAPTPPPAAPVESPDWLDNLAEPAAPSAEPAAPEPEPAASGQDMMDFLSGMDLGGPAPAAEGGEDLLGMTGDLTPSPAPAQKAEQAEAEPSLPEDLPDWLRSMQATPARSSGPAEPESTLSADALEEINDLRFDKLLPEESAPPLTGPEKVGALKDVIGAIRPEIIFDAQTLKAGQLGTEPTLTREQSQRIEMLEDLLENKTEEVVISGPRRRALPLARWLVTLLLIGAITAPIFLNFNLLTAPGAVSAGPADAEDMLGSLPEASKIVVAFDYEPDTSAEMEPLALAILGQIASQPDAAVYAISTRTTGPALAERAFQQALVDADEPQKERWLNLGYLPGGPNGITTLVVGSPLGLPSPLGTNALGLPSGLAETSLNELKPTLIVVLTASAEDLRAWVEQAGRPTSIPILAATSAGNLPMAAPYRQSGQIKALMSGVNDAVAFRALTDQESDPGTSTTWNSQATGALAAVLAIVVGGAIFGLAALRDKQEHGT